MKDEKNDCNQQQSALIEEDDDRTISDQFNPKSVNEPQQGHPGSPK